MSTLTQKFCKKRAVFVPGASRLRRPYLSIGRKNGDLYRRKRRRLTVRKSRSFGCDSF